MLVVLVPVLQHKMQDKDQLLFAYGRHTSNLDMHRIYLHSDVRVTAHDTSCMPDLERLGNRMEACWEAFIFHVHVAVGIRSHRYLLRSPLSSPLLPWTVRNTEEPFTLSENSLPDSLPHTAHGL